MKGQGVNIKNYNKYILLFILPIIVIAGSGFTFFGHKPQQQETQVEELPDFPKDEEITFDYYNEFPGTQNVNLYGLAALREINSKTVISPDKTKVAYTEIYFYPQIMQTASRAFYFTTMAQPYTRNTFEAHNPSNNPILMLDTNYNRVENQSFRTLTVVDWSQNGQEILIKETIGERQRGIWATNIWVYNCVTKNLYNLEAVRKAIVHYWKDINKLDIRNYRWDIVPLGWSIDYSNEVVVNVYGYDNNEKKFMGCWMIDDKGIRAKSLTLIHENWPVGKYGLVLPINEEPQH